MQSNEKYILGTKINHNLTYTSVCSQVESYLREGTRGLICTTNPEFVMKAQLDTAFKTIINSSLLSIPDGFGVLIALEFSEYVRKHKIKSTIYKSLLWCFFCLKCFIVPSKFGNTVTGVDLITYLCQLASDKGYSVFFLGGRPRNKFGKAIYITDYDIATETSEIMRARFPKLTVVGATSKFNSAAPDDVATTDYISECMSRANVTSIDIILVAYDFAAQEKWLVRNMDKINAKIGMGVGGSFDYLSHHVVRPPIIVRRLHLEWLFRLLIHPFRAKRVFNALAKFSVAMISFQND